MQADIEAQTAHGSSSPVPAAIDLVGKTDPEVAFWAGEGRAAVDNLMTGYILDAQRRNS
jgi:hypothetical protein